MPIPGYNLREEIARGLTQVVYRGTRERDGAQVIVRSLGRSFPTETEMADLRREYELLSSLRIPGVGRAEELLVLPDRLALVLEDRGGVPLNTILAHGPLEVDCFLRLGTRLAETLGALHDEGVIHKDVTPANILVDLATLEPTLIDFHVADRLGPGLPASGVGVLVGTLAYMAPEQTGRTSGSIDHRTDLYSLGVTFFEMLTGRLPFGSGEPLELVHSHVARLPPAPSDLMPSVPRAISDIVTRMLAKAPEQRYQSAAGVHSHLASCLAEWESTGRISDSCPGRTKYPAGWRFPAISTAGMKRRRGCSLPSSGPVTGRWSWCWFRATPASERLP